MLKYGSYKRKPNEGFTVCYQYINVMACFPFWHLISEPTKHHQTIRLCPHLGRIWKIFPKKVFQVFSLRVSPFFLESQVGKKSGYQRIFVAGWWKLFATTWAEIAENEEILHKPKLVQNSFMRPFHKGHAFQIWMFSKYLWTPW